MLVVLFDKLLPPLSEAVLDYSMLLHRLVLKLSVFLRNSHLPSVH